MDKRIKESVGTLLAHIIKIDNRDVEKEAPLFCKLMGESFDCSTEEAKGFLTRLVHSDYDLEEHLDIINDALCNDRLSKMHVMEQLNHIIYSDKITEQDYKEFERIKDRLFTCDVKK